MNKPVRKTPPFHLGSLSSVVYEPNVLLRQKNVGYFGGGGGMVG